MRAAVLFSGIGGWEIACEMHGIEVAWPWSGPATMPLENYKESPAMSDHPYYTPNRHRAK